MKTIYFILLSVMFVIINGHKIQAQEKAKPWSIGHYIKPAPLSKTVHKLGLRSVQSAGNISTN